MHISGCLLNDADRYFVKYKRYPPVDGDIIKMGPFPLKLIERDWAGDYFTFVRIDSLSGRLSYYWHRSCKILDLIYRRLIITAVVWNCASHETGVSVSWRDLYLVQFLQKLKNRKRGLHVV